MVWFFRRKKRSKAKRPKKAPPSESPEASPQEGRPADASIGGEPPPLPRQAREASNSGRDTRAKPRRPDLEPLSRIRELGHRLANSGPPEDARATGERKQLPEVAALDAVSDLKHWLEGNDSQTRRAHLVRGEYVKRLWELMGQFRRQGRLANALETWVLLLAASNRSGPEVLLLARDVAREYHKDLGLRLAPYRLWTFGIVIEAYHVAQSELPNDVQVAFGKLFDVLRIEWNKSREQVQEAVQLIERLCSLIHEPSARFGGPRKSLRELNERLTYWATMGRWRWSESTDPDWLCARFAALCANGSVDRDAGKLYRWCKARVAFESAGDVRKQLRASQLAAVAKEMGRWGPVLLGSPPKVSPNELARYFQALTLSEQGLGMRRGNVKLGVGLLKQLSQRLHKKPAIVLESQAVSEHVQPVLSRVDNTLRQCRP